VKKIALVFVLAVFVPSLVLAALALRSLRDQQLILRNKQAQLYQTTADGIFKDIEGYFLDRQREFASQVESILAQDSVLEAAAAFDIRLRKSWPLAEVGFAVSLDGTVYAPSLLQSHEARQFRLENDKFLCSRESVEVYWNSAKGLVSLSQLDEKSGNTKNEGQQLANANVPGNNSDVEKNNSLKSSKVSRSVMPQQYQGQAKETPSDQQFSKVAVAEAEFRQLVGDSDSGTLARFLQNKLHLMFWYRPPRNRQIVFGAQLDRKHLVDDLRTLVNQLDAALREEICAALVDDTGKPVATSRADFQTDWKHPFVAREVGEILPHWEVAVYLLHPAKLDQTAATFKLTLSLLVAVLILAIAVGGWLIVRDLNRQIALARQKTDFVSNVSHELKTPLTSIRMFSELLAEGRVMDRDKQKNYLNIITAETARLTRLINNVLDFSRLERGEKKYKFEKCDLLRVIRETIESYRPHLESNGFTLRCELPAAPIFINGDCDALAQVLVNLLSNAEKYSGENKEITVQAEQKSEPLAHVEVSVIDRGLGVPAGCEEKIFEQFYRAHDSLSSGIQGSGLGLTLARQIARAHGGDVICRRREEGGSCFALRLPLAI
jgi:signal transduction histidine kinase